METIKDILWPIAAFGGLGALIDFLIGKAGQVKAKDFLLKWWVRFDDVHWNNFGREGGLFAGQIINKWCGPRIWSLQRVIVATLLLLVYIGIGCAIYLASKSWTLCVDYCDQGSYSTLWALLIYFSGFSVSVSFTKFVAIRMAYLCGDNGARNFCIFLLILLLNYFLLIFWSPITSFIKFLIIVLPVILKEVSINDFIVSVAEMVTFGNMREAMISPEEIFRVDSGIDAFSLQFLSLSPSLFRLCLSVVFLGSFLFRPLVMRPLNLVWRRRCRK